MRCQRCASLRAVTTEDVDGTGGETCRLGSLAEDEVRKRVDLGGFNHDCVAGGQSRADAAGGNFQRKVPGNDLPRDAVGFIGGEVEVGRAERDRTALEAFGLVAVELEEARGAVDLDLRLPQRFAALQRQQRGNAVLVGADIGRHLLDHARPLDRSQVGQGAAVVHGLERLAQPGRHRQRRQRPAG